MGTKIFDLVTLTLVLDLLIKNFNLSYNFQIMSTKAWIFHMSIPCDKTFPWGQGFVTLTLVFDLLIKNFNLGYDF
jgi:hypothetical protein